MLEERWNRCVVTEFSCNGFGCESAHIFEGEFFLLAIVKFDDVGVAGTIQRAVADRDKCDGAVALCIIVMGLGDAETRRKWFRNLS